MRRSDLIVLPKYFDRYINLVDDIELTDALERFGSAYLSKEQSRFEALGDKVYAPGKWTIKDLLQHIIDAERVFAYRALRFARNDKTELPGFEEDLYAQNAKASSRTVADLLKEFELVRNSTLLMYKSFDREAIVREGVASGNKVSVLAIGFTICGHPIHHMRVIEERYFRLLANKC